MTTSTPIPVEIITRKALDAVSDSLAYGNRLPTEGAGAILWDAIQERMPDPKISFRDEVQKQTYLWVVYDAFCLLSEYSQVYPIPPRARPIIEHYLNINNRTKPVATYNPTYTGHLDYDYIFPDLLYILTNGILQVDEPMLFDCETAIQNLGDLAGMLSTFLGWPESSDTTEILTEWRVRLYDTILEILPNPPFQSIPFKYNDLLESLE